MTQLSGNLTRRPVTGLSPHEEMLLAGAEKALEGLGLDYQATARAQYLKICTHIAERQWLDASHIAHSIYGEAGSFQRPAMAKAAVLLRDILLSPNPAHVEPSIEVLRDGLSFFINLEVETNCDKTNNLLDALVRLASNFGIEGYK